MTQEVSYSVDVELPLDRAWDNLCDLSLAHNYVPGLTHTEITTDKRQGVGASRRVFGRQSGMKVAMDETVVDWYEGRGFRIRLHKGKKPAPPFKEAWFEYAIEPGEGDKTRLTCRMGYVMPLGIVGRFLGWLLKPVVAGNIRAVALSMKHFYETGERTPPAALKRLKADYP